MTEHRRAEVRAAPGRRLIGTPMVYGAEARVQMPDGRPVRERFVAGAFSEYLLSGKTTVNLQHDATVEIASTVASDRGLLELRDGPAELSMVATMPTGDVFDDVLAMVSAGDTAQLSVEFRALDEQVLGDRRIVRKATLPAVSLVDRGAYPQPIEVRRDGRGVRGSFSYNRDRVISNRGRVRKQRVSPGAFTYNMDRWNSLQLEMNAAIERGVEQGVREAILDRLDLTPDVTLLAGVKYDGAIGSMKAKSRDVHGTPRGR